MKTQKRTCGFTQFNQVQCKTKESFSLFLLLQNVDEDKIVGEMEEKNPLTLLLLFCIIVGYKANI